MAALLNVGTIFLMLFWQPNANQVYVLYLIAIFWGLADAIWQSQMTGKFCSRFICNERLIGICFLALYGTIFKSKEEAAFSNRMLW
jgi:hypothetical protein